MVSVSGICAKRVAVSARHHILGSEEMNESGMTVLEMIPHKIKRGAAALARLKAYERIPATAPDALKVLRFQKGHKLVDGPPEKKAEPEPSSEILTNPARVVPAQEKFIKFLEDSQYAPVKLAPSGFVLRDLHPNEPEALSLTKALASVASPASGSAAGQQNSPSAMAIDDEPQPPQPFEFTS
ncbi:hypothetical protein GOBAR_AA38478 [Gossypium barbadense]|uniref:26S proteasome regulatory subunit RPN2 C-terminal domain-containing protein n=1 Tax=Gossypium barbadense TaxID=3634 RepID=A0A2P5VTS1_GOSBA|nr:hypothetical protein GOBAR_AA38478 [Gossypium barbadense]